MIHFNILKVRYFSYFLSLGMIMFFIFGIFYKNKERGAAFIYSIEFSGGYQVNCEFKNLTKIMSAEMLKHELEEENYKGVSIRQFSNSNFLLRFSLQDYDVNNFIIEKFEHNLKETIDKKFNGVETVIIDSTFVGPGVGNDLVIRAMWSIIFALVLMFFYIWMRFPSWIFSLANIVSLMHDVLIILLFLMWANIEISLDSLIAILFIIGYSINDTVVIFAKIREKMQLNSVNAPSSDIINTSIAVTLKRTLLTSGFTFLVVFPLWLFGGVALENLVAPILLGILFGTYSSIAIACSVLYDSFLCFNKCK